MKKLWLGFVVLAWSQFLASRTLAEVCERCCRASTAITAGASARMNNRRYTPLDQTGVSPQVAAWARFISHHKKFLDWSRIC